MATNVGSEDSGLSDGLSDKVISSVRAVLCLEGMPKEFAKDETSVFLYNQLSVMGLNL